MYKVSSRQKLCTSFISIRPKIWSLEHTQGFSKVWPSDLVFDPTWPIFQVVRDFMKTNILTNFHDNRTENVASRVNTWFSKRFYQVFDPKWPIFNHNQDFINIYIPTKFHDNRTENVASRAYTRFFQDLNLWPSFWPCWTIFELIRDFIKTNILTFMIIGLKMWTLESTQAKKFQREKIFSWPALFLCSILRP